MKPNYNRVIQANEQDENIGFCLACGHEQECVEPDACNYTCDICKEKQVFGREEILMMIS